MINFLKQQTNKLLAGCKAVAVLIKDSSSQASNRVLTIEKNKDDDFIIKVQLINTSQTFIMRPEEILASDDLTDSFSPRDIRTLTYLGYLSLNSPKYKILAKKLSENDNKLIFAIKEKGKQKPIIKSANEISSDEKFLQGLLQKDAHMIGFAAATEQALTEQQEKKDLLTLSSNPNNP